MLGIKEALLVCAYRVICEIRHFEFTDHKDIHIIRWGTLKL